MISGEEDVIVTFLLQCDLTRKEGSRILPADPNLEDLMREVAEREEEISSLNPDAYIIWTIPIVRKFKVPDEAPSRPIALRWQKDMARTERAIKDRMNESGRIIFDLSRTFRVNDERLVYNTHNTLDSIHPTEAGICLFFKQFREQLMTLGILRKIEKRRKNIETHISYEEAE